MAAATPPALKAIVPYIKQGAILQKHDTIMSYYCHVYATQLGINSMGSDPNAKKYIIGLLTQCEAEKKQIGSILNEDGMQKDYVENFAYKVFDLADNQDRSGHATKDTAKSFFASQLFFDVLKQFGELDTEHLEKQKYAKWRAAAITQALKNGQTPPPPPKNPTTATDDDLDRELAALGPSGGSPNVASPNLGGHPAQFPDFPQAPSHQSPSAFPDFPSVPSQQSRSSQPSFPDFPSIPGGAKPNQSPSFPDFPSVPGGAKANQPSFPDFPSIPQQPSNQSPSFPDFPSIPQGKASSPSFPSVPQHPSNQPSFPDFPPPPYSSKPAAPDFPSFPNVPPQQKPPQQPQQPQFPQFPQQPQQPQLPQHPPQQPQQQQHFPQFPQQPQQPQQVHSPSQPTQHQAPKQAPSNYTPSDADRELAQKYPLAPRFLSYLYVPRSFLDFHRYSKFVYSALEYNDVPTAVKNLKLALAKLTGVEY